MNLPPLLDLIIGSKNDPAALAQSLEQWFDQRITATMAQVNSDAAAQVAQVNKDAQERIEQVLDGVAATMLEVKALVSKIDGATATVTFKLGIEPKGDK